ncbi:putative ankyrin repeat protein RF_0381 [Homalodisca vitripennis]|uniref:putative ankyrin repeat protein RF_0381 n=1 Tax=Homalodisca vitripennis TaxID=197043 RepID=UPI001EEC0854|nr:putative ankyrin repeat protein RF_0381 [Homalodisca vitripennis]XP_046675433.1 putative ankyrin repeat protein RF_0381 [Homalodisca vitripennis]
MTFVYKFITGNYVNNNMYNGIYFGHVERIKEIIASYGFSHEPKWEEGYDLLIVAIDSQNIHVAKSLVMLQCKLQKTEMENSKSCKPLLRRAIRNGDCELVSMLLERIPSEIWLEYPLVHWAVSEGRRDMVKLLLQRGVDIEARNKARQTALHLAAVEGHADIVQELVMSGADIESRDYGGRTSLFMAVSAGHLDVVKELLVQEANTSCKFNGLTPMYVAVSKGYTEIFMELLEFGADFEGTDDFGQTPLHIACLKNRASIVSILLEAGANVNVVDARGMVPGSAVFGPTDFHPNYNMSLVPMMLAKQFTALKAAGLFLNEENEIVFGEMYEDLFFRLSDNRIVTVDGFLNEVMECCKAEVLKMKEVRCGNAFSVYSIFRRIQEPTPTATLKEIEFLETLNLEEEFPNYKNILKRFIARVKERKGLLSSGEEWLSLFLNYSGHTLPIIPPEVKLIILSYLKNEDLKQLNVCGKQLFS